MARLRSISVTLAAALAPWLSGCGDNRVAGGSTGVDNPAFTVAFKDGGGTALRSTGDLDLFAADQNPAVDPEPLGTVKVKSSSLTKVYASDLFREVSAKLAASAKVAAPESLLAFNLVFRSDSSTGGLALGLAYDTAARAFRWSDTSLGGKLENVDIRLKALVRYRGDVARDNLKLDGVTRVFIPGTKYMAALTDTGFVFDDLPEGTFPVRVLAQDGRIFAAIDSLKTGTSSVLTCDPHPVDTLPGRNPIPDFHVFGIDRQLFMPVTGFGETLLESKVTGVDPANPRLSYRWTLLGSRPDSLRAEILTPFAANSQVRFKSPGLYDFVIVAAIDTVVRRDTATIVVDPPPHPSIDTIVLPQPGDTVVFGKQTKIQWGMIRQGAVRIQVSTDSGATWKSITDHYENTVPIFPWTPNAELGESDFCLIQISLAADSNVFVRMKGPFHLLKGL